MMRFPTVSAGGQEDCDITFFSKPFFLNFTYYALYAVENDAKMMRFSTVGEELDK